VHQQAALLERQPQVLAAPAHFADMLADDRLGRAAERPAQRLADADGRDARTADALGKAQPGDFDFRQLGHRQRRRATLSGRSGGRFFAESGNYHDRLRSHLRTRRAPLAHRALQKPAPLESSFA
jgi:hypothetical protein